MVPDLEQRAGLDTRSQQLLLDQCVRVPHQEDAQRVHRPQLEQQHDRFAVRRPARVLAEPLRRPQARHPVVRAREDPLPAHDLECARRAGRPAALFHRGKDPTRHVARAGHPAAGHVADDRRQTSQVVEVAVRREHGVERVNPARPERRHDHACALVERRVRHAAIHDQRPPVGKAQQHAVALPDVEQRPHERMLPRRRPGHEDRRRPDGADNERQRKPHASDEARASLARPGSPGRAPHGARKQQPG